MNFPWMLTSCDTSILIASFMAEFIIFSQTGCVSIM